MSTALIGGLALQGTPQDYSNVAARRDQAAAARAAKPNRERDALDKQILGALRADAHPAVMEELEMRNVEGFRHVYNLFESGDLNAARAALIQLKNDNDHVARTSKQLYELERFSSQGGYHFPPGWSEFVRSPEFRAGGESRIKAAEEFFNREENQPYKSLFGVGLDGQRRFTIAYDANLGKKADAGAMFGKSANRIRNMALSEEVGVIDTERNQSLSATQIKERVYQLGMEKAIDIFEQEAANRTFLYNAAMAFPGLRQPKDSPEYQDAREAFIDANLPGTVKTYIGRPSGGSGSSDRSKGEVSTDRAIVLQTPGGKFSFNTVSYSIPQKVNVSMNVGTAGSFKLGTEGTYTELSEKEREATDMAMQVSSIDIIPVYTGETKKYTFTDENDNAFVITLKKGMPVPVDNINRAIEANPNVNKELSGLTYEYRPFATALGAQDVVGAKTETYVIPLTDANRNRITANTKDQRLQGANWKQAVFGEYASQIGEKGAFGTGSGQPRQQAAPAPTPQGGSAPIPTVRQSSGQGAQQDGRRAPNFQN